MRTTFRTAASGEVALQRSETYTFSSALGDYRRTTITEPSGSTTAFTYDATDPDRVTLETRSAPGGLMTVGSHTMGYRYDSAGRVDREFRPGPNWTGSPACSAAGTGCTETVRDYDYFGRQVSDGPVAGTESRTRLTRYNAFDEVIVTRDAAGLARATYYNTYGQREHEYSCAYTGALVAFGSAASPPAGCDLLSETHFEYHPLSGRVTHERVVLSDTVPFSFSISPTITADTVSSYDPQTGRWLQSVSVGGLSPATYQYDYQGRVAQRTSAAGISTKSEFDGRGLLHTSRVWNPTTGATLSLLTTYEHGPDGQLLATTDPAGVRTQYEYNNFGWREQVLRCGEQNPTCASPLTRTQTQYDGAANILRQFVVDEIGQGVSDTAMDYDHWNRPYRVRRRVHFNELASINDDDESDDGVADEVTLTVFDPAGLERQTARTATGDSLSVNSLADTIVEKDYNAFGEMLHGVQPAEDLFGDDNAVVIQYVPDFAGRVLGKRQCKDAPIGGGDCSTDTASLWDYAYDAAGRVIKAVDPEGHYTESFYDSRGHLVRRIAFEQPAAGNRTGVGGVAKSQQRWRYDAAGRLSQTVEMSVPSAAATTPANPLTDRIVDRTHDADGRTQSQTVYASFGPNPDASPATTAFGYDPLGRLETTTDALGNVSERQYHATTGRLESVSVADGLQFSLGSRVTSFHYDVLGRVESEIEGEGGSEPLITNYTYDALDRVRTVSRWVEAEVYFTIEQQYDLLGRRGAVIEAPGGGMERITSRTYDRLGRLRTVTGYDADPGTSTTHAQTTTYEYDRQGRRMVVHYPGLTGGSETIQSIYDRFGRLHTQWDLQNRESLYTYDKRGMLLTKTLCSEFFCGGGNDSPVDTFTYDGLGRLKFARRDVRVSGGALTTQSTITLGYDAFSNRTSETQDLFGSVALGQSFVYDQVGNRVQSNCPNGSHPFLPCVENYYDVAGRLVFLLRNSSQIADYIFTNGGAGEHLESRTLYGAGFIDTLESQSTHDAHRRQTLLENRRRIGATSTLLSSFDPTFDGLGNRKLNVIGGDTALSDSADNVYSQLQQLRISSHLGGLFAGDEQFLTDRLGNRNSANDTRPAADVNITYVQNTPANEYPWIGSSSMTLQYDPSGNLIRDEKGRMFFYDLEDHLIEVKDSAGKSLATWTYDALGRRVSETRSGKTTYFYYDGDRVVAEYEKSGSTSVPRRYFVDGPMYVDEHLLLHERDASGAEADFYFVQDPMYSVSALTDANGNVVEIYRYDAFGGLSFTPKVEPVGGRYLRVTLPDREPGVQGENKIRIRVRLDCAGSTWKYVGTPNLNARNGAGWAKLVDSVSQPGETTAGMAGYGGWGPVVYVTGGDIVPGRKYVVEVEHRLDGVTVATQTARTATLTSKWGDVDGNGSVNFQDVSRIVSGFQGNLLDNSAYYAADLKGDCTGGSGGINFQDVSICGQEQTLSPKAVYTSHGVLDPSGRLSRSMLLPRKPAPTCFAPKPPGPPESYGIYEEFSSDGSRK